MSCVTFGIIGVSGYGATHVHRLKRLEQERKVKFSCFAEIITPRSKPMIETLTSEGRKHFENYEEMLEQPLDAVIIATPIHLHKEMALACFRKGIHVYLEKPPVVLLEHLDELLQAKEKYGVACQVGFQHASSESIHRIVDTIQSGTLGSPYQISSVGKWKRYDTYYNRSPWSGKLSINGVPVLDGTVMNPLSHLLNTSVYIAESIQPNKFTEAEAELYKGHSFIESEDTCCARFAADGLKLGFYTSVCCREQTQPFIKISCEKGYVFWGYDAYYIRRYGEKMSGPFPTTMGDLTVNLIDHLNDGTKLQMPLEKSRGFVLAANAIFASSGKINGIPESFIEHEKTEQGESSTVLSIEHFMDEAAAETKLFSEIDVPWAHKGSKVNLNQLHLDWQRMKG